MENNYNPEQRRSLLLEINNKKLRFENFKLLEENQELNKKITELSIDSLTECPTSNWLSKNFISKIVELDKSDKEKLKQNFAVIYADIDYLKLINDSISHEAGDILIATSINSIKKGIDACKSEELIDKASLYGSNFIARRGGDEFIAIIWNNDAVDPVKFKYKTQRIFTSAQYDSQETLPESIKRLIDYDTSFSFGISLFNGDISESINEAENNMFKQKVLNHGSSSMRPDQYYQDSM